MSNYLSDKREPDFQMLSEMAYFLGVDLNYFSNKNFKKKRKDDIFEIAEDGYVHGFNTFFLLLQVFFNYYLYFITKYTQYIIFTNFIVYAIM